MAHIEDLQARWREHELHLTSYMEKMNAWAARQAKREKRAAQKLIEEPQTATDPAQMELPQTPEERKAELRRRVFGAAAGRGGNVAL